MNKTNEYRVSEFWGIPDKWEVKNIKDFCITSSGGTPNRNTPEFYLNGEIPWIKTGELSSKYLFNSEEKISKEALKMSSAKLFSVDTILVAMYGATIGKSSILKIPAATNQACCAIMPDRSLSDIEFTYYAIQNRVKELIELGAGGAQPNISQSIIGNFPIPLPPLPEQQKIADILSTVDEHISETESLLEKAKVLKQGMMQRLLTKGIGHTEFKDSEIGKIPVDWEVVTLRSISDLITKGSTPTTYGFSFVDEGVNFIKIESIDDSRGVFKDDMLAKISNECHTNFLRSQLKKNDILFAIAGAIGKCIIVSPNVLPANTNQALSIIRLKNGIYTQYIFQQLKGPLVQSSLDQLKTTTAQANISLDQISNFIIPFPTIPEQQKIATILASINDQTNSYQTKLTALTKLKSALMQQLLTGKTRVKI